jgi:PAS domain S-box-containing protein
MTLLNSVLKYFNAIVFFLIALGIRYYLLPADAGLQYITFYPLVPIVAILFGIWPASLAVLLSLFAADYFFIPTYYEFKLFLPHKYVISEAIYFLSGIGIILLIRKAKKNEADLKIAAHIFESQEGMLVTNENNRILKVNKALESMTGYSNEEIIGNKPNMFSSGQHDQEFFKKMWSTLINEGKWSGEVIDKRKDGTTFVKNVNISVIKDKNGKVTNYISTHVDMTVQKKAEKELSDAKLRAEEASRAKSDFLSNMGHEIRAPLSAIVGFTEVLKDSGLNSEQKDYVEIICRSEQHLLCLINDILDLSKIESGKLEIENTPFQLSHIIKRVEELTQIKAQEKQINLIFKMDSMSINHFIGDSLRISQILINLISNAIKFTPQKGTVTVKLEKGMRVNSNQKNIQFSVQDTGIGISQEKLNSLFSRFIQADNSIARNFGGTGLGLAISKNLVNLMGGHLAVESVEGTGTKFSFHLTLTINQTLDKTASELDYLKEINNIPPLKILLVEDTLDLQKLMQLYFKKTNFQLDLAENGKIAFEKYTQNKFDLILMDMQMPVMDGATATKEIRKWELANNKKKVPIFALTGNAFKEDAEISLQAGCDLHLVKPVQRKILFDSIINYFKVSIS